MDNSFFSAKAFRLALITSVFAATGPLLGCRICADCEDLAYPAYGGAWQRTNREHGRVGSVFDPGGAKNSQLVSRDTPLVPDEIERQRRSRDDTNASGNDESLFESFENDQDESEGNAADNVDQDELEMRNRERKLRDLNLEDIRVLPASPTPPLT